MIFVNNCAYLIIFNQYLVNTDDPLESTRALLDQSHYTGSGSIRALGPFHTRAHLGTGPVCAQGSSYGPGTPAGSGPIWALGPFWILGHVGPGILDPMWAPEPAWALGPYGTCTHMVFGPYGYATKGMITTGPGFIYHIYIWIYRKYILGGAPLPTPSPWRG